MGLMDWLFGSSGGMEQVSSLTPQQQELMNQLVGGLGPAQMQGLQYLNSILSGDPEAFSAFEAPMKRQFEQETIPMIAERFAGMGSHGAQGSSAQDLAFGQAGRELSENLAAMREGLKQQSLGQLQGLLGMGMRPTFENVYMQPTGGALGGLLTGAGGGAGMAVGAGPLAQLFNLGKSSGGGAGVG